MSCTAVAALHAHCETFPQPPELHSTQSPIMTDGKGECKVQVKDSSCLAWLWPHDRNCVGARASMC